MHSVHIAISKEKLADAARQPLFTEILQRSSQGNPSVGDVYRKRVIKMERCDVRVSHLLMSFVFEYCNWQQ